MIQNKSHPKYERSLVVIKPDGVQRALIGEIINRFEKVGLKLIGIKMFVPDNEFVKTHYTLEDNWIIKTGEKSIKNFVAKGLTPPISDPEVWGNKILGNLQKYFTSGPVVAMVWQGAHAVGIVRKLIGSTEPFSSDVGTIRGDYVLDSYEMSGADDRAIRNIAHASSSKEEGEKEISLWFKEEELLNYRLIQDEILYDVNLDGILE